MAFLEGKEEEESGYMMNENRDIILTSNIDVDVDIDMICACVCLCVCVV